MVFHSFRHALKAACRRTGLQDEVHDLLSGHNGAGVGRGCGGAEEYSDELVSALAAGLCEVEFREEALSAVRPSVG